MNRSTLGSPLNLDLLEATYNQWRREPGSVDPSWNAFFEGFELGLGRSSTTPAQAAVSAEDERAQSGIVRLIFAYRDLGHTMANINPLGPAPSPNPLLELNRFGLEDKHFNQYFLCSEFVGSGRMSLKSLLEVLKETYCRTIGVEFMHIQDISIRRWLEHRMEPRRNQPGFDVQRKMKILKHLKYAELFERFLHTRFVGQKRFSLEGAETLIPMLEAVVEGGPSLSIQEMVVGMAHRGRLNVLANILRKPYEEIFTEFEENYHPEQIGGDGDVKYHLGFSSDRATPGGPIHLSLTPNPSHLEAVNPVVEGRTRAKQDKMGDGDRLRCIPILIHGDAAFAGQGLVAETLNLSQLEGYTTGGTVHLVINNQVGFTTSPRDARSTPYCTDIAKMLQVPVFHVNAEDPEAAVYVAELALEFRQQFKRDVVIDLICYRRQGHNETDEPSYTQPVMYSAIRQRPTLSVVYTDRLVSNGDITAEEARTIDEKFESKLNASLDQVRNAGIPYHGMEGFKGSWKGFVKDYSFDPAHTSLERETLVEILQAGERFPEGFQPNPKLLQILKGRTQAALEDRGLDWATGENLAFGSLLLEGTPVRLSGQDCRRGTFSHRHATLVNSVNGEFFTPLNTMRPDQAVCQIYDSMLSEGAVLGFDFGFSMDSPKTLVLWEAQFGDFSNGAQVIIDQFLCSSESKWKRDSGIVMLLPHGYEGQGPEHSSARLERFLQLCAEDNIQVANLTTPAQYFHMLRRQMKRNFRKPLVIMTPKSLLRHKAAVSPVSEFTSGFFQEILDDPQADPSTTTRIILCSGKVYYDLLEERNRKGAKQCALLRIEQLYPLNEAMLRGILSRYTKAMDYVWAQEESQNMGAWYFIEPRLRAMGINIQYVGRDASASPATGSKKVHEKEQKELVEVALVGNVPHLVKAPGAVATDSLSGLGSTPPVSREKRAITSVG